MTSERVVVRTERAPISSGPISQAVRFGNLVFTAGITARDPATGALLDGDIRAATRRVLGHIETILEAAGSSMALVLQLRCYLRDFDQDFAGWNEVYREFFSADWPARTVIPAPLGEGFQLEVDVVAGIESD